MSIKTRGFALAFAVLAPTAAAQIPTFTQNFEGLNAADSQALATDGWVVFGNVFEAGTGNFLFGYGTFPAPNQDLAFSSVASGNAGPAQGVQYLNVFNDYNNVAQHQAGNRVEANVFHCLLYTSPSPRDRG